jgi:hypothetical protein
MGRTTTAWPAKPLTSYFKQEQWACRTQEGIMPRTPNHAVNWKGRAGQDPVDKDWQDRGWTRHDTTGQDTTRGGGAADTSGAKPWGDDSGSTPHGQNPGKATHTHRTHTTHMLWWYGMVWCVNKEYTVLTRLLLTYIYIYRACIYTKYKYIASYICI